MKKLVAFWAIAVLLSLVSQTFALWVANKIAVPVDNQIIDTELTWITQDLSVNFNVQKFSSCDNYKDVMKKFIEDYHELHPNSGYGWPMIYDDVMIKANSDTSISKAEVWSSIAWSAASDKLVATDYSKTNIQVWWVDESEIIKNDWKYIYFYNSKDSAIYIAEAFPAKNLKISKKINLPKTFVSPELYLDWGKLTIVATKYSNSNFNYYWFNREVKTIVVNYDISDLNNLKLEKYFQVDWSYSKSRKIGDYVYVLSESNFSFPYNNYYSTRKWWLAVLDEEKLDKDFDAKKILPKKAELRITSNKSEQNVKIKWKDLPYNISWEYASKCSDIEYVIPDKETMKKFDFTPSYATLSIINVKDSIVPTKTKLLFWNVGETYMSLDNLYITSNLYTTYNFKCPQIQCIKAPCPQLDCMMPVFNNWQNTLIHKISINKDTAKYEKSTIIPGSPLNQYSMDEKDWNFRIVTTNFFPNKATSVYVLDKNLKTIWKLDWIGKDENFQSSRFIGDKLYLVTFKQIDPLFVIDLKDSTSPKILWELKIPWYSTYLHPYDDNHLIWLGYDTGTWAWGWTVNNWLKVDLYDITDINNPKQQYSLTLWNQWSTSDALNNPRLFVWDSKNKNLFLPATLYTSWTDKSNPYRYSNAFQWSIAIKIDAETWIKELARATHIDSTRFESKRQEECKQYAVKETPKCEKIIGWWEYCPPANDYIPPYCYESSTTWEYFANQIWNFSDSFILRNIYMDNYWYTISNSKIEWYDTTWVFSQVWTADFK